MSNILVNPPPPPCYYLFPNWEFWNFNDFLLISFVSRATRTGSGPLLSHPRERQDFPGKFAAHKRGNRPNNFLLASLA